MALEGKKRIRNDQHEEDVAEGKERGAVAFPDTVTAGKDHLAIRHSDFSRVRVSERGGRGRCGSNGEHSKIPLRESTAG